MIDDILSTIASAPASYAVYSSMSFFAPRHGGELPGTWFVAALGALGYAPAAVRQTLFRMAREQELTTRRAGRAKFYRLTSYARAEVDAGLQKIFDRTVPRWDGEWTVVSFSFSADERVPRDRVRSILQVEGFAPVGTACFIHPQNRGARIASATGEFGVADNVLILRGKREGEADARRFLREHWPLGEIAQIYRDFVKCFSPLFRRGFARVTDEQVFALRYAVVFDFLRAAWQDPELPLELLPTDWPGARARTLAREMYEKCLPAALRHAESLLP
jgi:phenylacetic acid degradation operon negative regulatory protein